MSGTGAYPAQGKTGGNATRSFAYGAVEAITVVYQRGTIAVLRHPSDVIARMSAELGEIEGDLVLFCGTLPLLDGGFVYGDHWQLEIRLPDGMELIHEYETTRRGART